LFKATGERTLELPGRTLVVDGSHPAERWLEYAYFNLLRHYKNSPLGQHMASLKRGTFVDVGANLGFYCMVANDVGYCSVAIEPEPRHAAFLRRNLESIGAVLPVGLSDATGDLPLYYSATNSGATSLWPDSSYLKSESSVEVETFSRLASAGLLGDLADIRLVKVDVEGLEDRVVSGMQDYLTDGWRPDLWIEVRGDRSGRNGGTFRRVASLLTEFGYVMAQVPGVSTASSTEALANREVFDVLFRPRESKNSRGGTFDER
jgi:FkbM family methyltransferase